MNILVVHQNFPGQFKHLAPALVAAGHSVRALVPAALGIQEWNGVKLIPYSLRRGNAKDAHPWIVDVESKVIRGEACLRVALGLKEKGYVPDIILAHPGWGESLFLKEVWPNAKLKLYCEFFYHARQADVDFDPEFSSKDPANAGRVALKNANLLLQFHNAESGLSPTFWQASTFPEYIRGKIFIVHDGIDTDLLKPNPAAELTLPCGKVLTNQDEVVTYVARGLEPYRGFHIFMRALPELLKARPAAEVVIIGGEGVSYGREHPSGRSWKVLLCDEVMPLLTVQQRARIHFMGRLNYSQFQAMLQVSRVHVYLTYPFVLSWSLLEAMSTGCSVVASDTQPVQEVIKNNETGRLFDFFDPSALAGSVTDLLENANVRMRLGKSAREFAVQNYDLTRICLPKQIEWLLS